jgi:hypothetical protein
MKKTREVRREVGHGRWTFYNDPPISLPPRILLEKGEVSTFNHDLSRLGKGDEGGPFWSSQSRYESEGTFHRVQGLGRVYEGDIHVSQVPPVDVAYPKMPVIFDDLVSLGATAISRTVPTNPVAGAGVAIGEAREGFPRLIGHSLFKSRLKDIRKAGDEYLNVEFGWKPLISDLMKFTKSMKQSNKLLRQMYRDSGTGNSVRRRYQFPDQEFKSPTGAPQWGFVAPFKCDGSQLDSWMLGNGPEPTGYIPWTTEKTETWFSGAYSYVMPPPPSNFWEKMSNWEREANKLYGTRITPDVLWNIAPWSWAADWFANTGDIVSNISAFGSDSLALKYGYIMRKTRSMNQYVWQGYINTPSGPNRFIQIREAFGSETRVRLRATPYGFGTTIESLTPRQIAISASLGIGRAPRARL